MTDRSMDSSEYLDYVFTDTLAIEAKNFGFEASVISTSLGDTLYPEYGTVKRILHIKKDDKIGIIEYEDLTTVCDYRIKTKINIRAMLIGLLHGKYYKRVSGFNKFRLSPVAHYCWPKAGMTTDLIKPSALRTCTYGFHIARLTDMWFWKGDLVLQVEPCGTRLYHASDKCVANQVRVVKDIGTVTWETHFAVTKKIIQLALDDFSECQLKEEFRDTLDRMGSLSEARELICDLELFEDTVIRQGTELDYRVYDHIMRLASIDQVCLFDSFPGLGALTLVEQMSDTTYAGYRMSWEEYIACVACEVFTGEKVLQPKTGEKQDDGL